VNIVVIGAHPDDCEFFAGGTAVRLVESGHRVTFVSVTNGDAGHMRLKPDKLARIRRAEVTAADSLLGVSDIVLDNHDGRLMPDLSVREELIRIIRREHADAVFTHRPWDYHPDHRNTAVLVQDTAYLVIVPNVCPDTPALAHNPLYFYLQDEFAEPVPFRPDIIVPIDDVWATKVRAMHLMPSQFYEWLPFTFGTLADVPEGEDKRLAWLDGVLREWMKPPYRHDIERLYGPETSAGITMAEAFQLCPFGRIPAPEELRELFPFLPGKTDATI